MVEQGGLDANYVLKDDDRIYLTPDLYSRYDKVSETVHLFAIKRPALDASKIMACGVNSAYHFVRKDAPEEIVKLFEHAIISHDYSHPIIRDILNKHQQSKHWNRKGGKYLATLAEYDAIQPSGVYPEVSFLLKDIKNQPWEEIKPEHYFPAR